MTTTPTSLSRPAAAMAEHARHTAHLRSHRAQIDEWLRELNLTSIEQLFDAVGGPDAKATATLLGAHQRRVTLATTVLAGAKARILSAIARHAPGDSVEERLQVTLEAFLTRALPRVKPGHPYVDQQLYFITLRTVTKRHDKRPAKVDLSFDVPGADVAADIDGYLTGGVLLQWGVAKGYLSESDRQALAVRYGGPKALPVREVAAQLGVHENKLESQLRRAVARLREGVAAQRDELDRACVAARWAVDPAAENASVSPQVGVAA